MTASCGRGSSRCTTELRADDREVDAARAGGVARRVRRPDRRPVAAELQRPATDAPREGDRAPPGGQVADERPGAQCPRAGPAAPQSTGGGEAPRADAAPGDQLVDPQRDGAALRER